MPELVDLHPIAGINKDRCAGFLYHCGSFEPVAGSKSGTSINFATHRLFLENQPEPATPAAVCILRRRSQR